MTRNNVMKSKGVSRFDALQVNLARAKTLAVFCNLKRGEIQQFRKDYPDFFPDSWWKYKPTHSSKAMQWEIVQNSLREAWQQQFNIPLMHFTFFLLNSVFEPTETVLYEDQPRPATIRDKRIFDIETYPYHEAVQWMVGQGWRARQCEQCGKYLVADTSQQKYCPINEPCFWVHRKADQREWAEKHKDEVNKRRRQVYKKAKQKRKA
jgi:hypothetical protein